MISIVVQFAIAPGAEGRTLHQAGCRWARPAGRVPNAARFSRMDGNVVVVFRTCLRPRQSTIAVYTAWVDGLLSRRKPGPIAKKLTLCWSVSNM